MMIWRLSKPLLISTYILVLLVTFIALLPRHTSALHAAPIATTYSSLVDITQDLKAMGYPDGRKIVRDQAGHLYVAYRKKYKQHQLTAYHIFVAKSHDNGATWQVLNGGRPIEKVGDYNQRVPAIAIDQQQVIHVVWYGKDAKHNGNDENQIKYVRSSNGGATWSTWQNIAPISGYQGQSLWQEHPTIYIDTMNTIYVAWEGRDSYYTDNSQVKLIKSLDGGASWSTWRNIVPGQGSRSRPALVAVQDTLYLLAYGRVGARQQILYTSTSDDGRNWRAWSQIAASGQDQRHFSVDTDQQGKLHVAWRQTPDQFFGQKETRIHYANFDGRRWSVPVQVAPFATGAQTFPSLGVDGQDAVWITWSTTRAPYAFPNDAPEEGAIEYIVKSKAGWSDHFTLSTGGNDLYASLGRRNNLGDGAMGLIWLATDATVKQIRFAELIEPTQYHTTPPFVRSGFFGAISVILGAIDTLTLHQPQLGWLPTLGSSHLAREVNSLLLVILVVTGYVIIKFLITRHRHFHPSSTS